MFTREYLLFVCLFVSIVVMSKVYDGWEVPINKDDPLYYGLLPRDGLHIELSAWPRPGKLISWSGHDERYKIITAMRITPWRQGPPPMKILMNGLSAHIDLADEDVASGQWIDGDIPSYAAMVGDKYAVVYQNTKDKDISDIRDKLARMITPHDIDVLVDLRQRTGLPPEAFLNHSEHDPRHDAAWCPWLATLGSERWNSISISGNGIRRSLVEITFSNETKQSSLLIYDDNGLSDIRPLAWIGVSDILPSVGSSSGGYWLSTIDLWSHWHKESMNAILSRHPSLKSLASKVPDTTPEETIHHALVLTALWNRKTMGWEQRYNELNLSIKYNDVIPLASYMLALSAGIGTESNNVGPDWWSRPGKLWKTVDIHQLASNPSSLPMWILPLDWATLRYLTAVQGLVHRGGLSIAPHGIVEIGSSAAVVVDACCD